MTGDIHTVPPRGRIVVRGYDLTGLPPNGPEWRELRNAFVRDMLPDDDARALVMDWSDIIDWFDDIIDGDRQRTEEDAIRIMWEAVVNIPRNPFFHRWHQELVPLMNATMNTWIMANHIERNGGNMELAYGLRYTMHTMVMAVVEITRGREFMLDIMPDFYTFFNYDNYPDWLASVGDRREKT